jgi:hypothetical protein
VSALVLLALLIAETYNVYPRYYLFTRLVFWLFVFSSMVAHGLCNRDYFSVLERVIYKLIFFFPLLFLLFLLVPFIGIGFGLMFYAKFIGSDKFILYNDSNIRIEQPSMRFMGPDPQPVLYRKNRFSAFQDTILSFQFNEKTDKIEVTREGDSLYIIILRAPDNWQVPTGTDTFYYRPENLHGKE